VFEVRKAKIDVEVLNLTELGEPIRKIEWKTVYEDTGSLSQPTNFFSDVVFHTSGRFKTQRLLASI